jgi:hypothetical protein
VAAILISHFLLNLRYLNVHSHETAQSTHLTGLDFAHWPVQSAIIDDLGDHTINKSVNGDIKLKDMVGFDGEVGLPVEDEI